ncbi:hypothetical protein EGK40_13135 [Enterococcus faecium]|nr:hypothetical protein EGK40_13135 [Enterococcus faecium]RSA92650.1 hypothetical protein EGK51_13115 [Enterococcus faecium]RSB00415.1 hypothetical protein EGK45_13120 [Enterococcus faecium]RSD61159.1 hypothetical protein EGP45_13160 [Enterococcus faecium]
MPNNRILLVFSITIKGAVFLIKELFNLNKRKDSIAKAIKLFLTRKTGSIIYGTDESELILQPHFHFRY